jgi:UDP-glucose 4-epimerase
MRQSVDASRFGGPIVSEKTTTKRASTSRAGKKTTTRAKGSAQATSTPPDGRELVLVTGASGGLGRLLCKRLHRSHAVIAVDHRPFPDRPKDVEHHRLDLRRKSAYDVLKKKRPRAIVHMGGFHNPQSDEAYHSSLEVTSQLLRFAEQVGIPKLVLLSTANLYGPSATSSGFLTEEAPLLAAGRSPEVRDLIAVDMMVQSFFWKRPEIETVILRPVHIVGPHLKNAPSKYLRLRRIPSMLGFDPMVQLIHETDAADAIIASLKPGIRGVFNITGPGQAPLSRLVRVTGHPQMPVPGPIFEAVLERLFKFHLTNFPATELDHLRYSCLVDGSRATTALGISPRRGLRETVLDIGN